MATQAMTRSHFGPIEHLRRPMSVLDRVAERQGKFVRMKARQAVEGLKEQGPELKAVAVAQGVSGAAALGFGYLHGRYEAKKLMVGPVPWELALGFGAHLMAFSPPGRQYAPYLHAAGIGALNSFLHSFGRGLGRKARKAAGLPPVMSESLLSGDGEGEVTGGGALSDEELARLARRA
jgi:hypothetical protein